MTKYAETDWKSVVRSVAPMLGTALGGPLAGLASRVIAEALFEEAPEKVNLQKVADMLCGKVAGGTMALEKLKQAEREFAMQMRAMDIDLAKLDMQDRASARLRQQKTGDNLPNWLGVLVLCGFFATVAFVLLHGLNQIDAASAAFAGTLVGYVSAKADQVIAYFFGSSSGSREKTRALAEVMQRGNAP